jgi:hypothetical protein
MRLTLACLLLVRLGAPSWKAPAPVQGWSRGSGSTLLLGEEGEVDDMAWRRCGYTPVLLLVPEVWGGSGDGKTRLRYVNVRKSLQ